MSGAELRKMVVVARTQIIVSPSLQLPSRRTAGTKLRSYHILNFRRGVSPSRRYFSADWVVTCYRDVLRRMIQVSQLLIKCTFLGRPYPLSLWRTASTIPKLAAVLHRRSFLTFFLAITILRGVPHWRR